MRIVLISDTHTHQGLQLPDGDVLVHAGDATRTGTAPQVDAFLDWFAAQTHPNKILVAGNHDWLFQRQPGLGSSLLAEHPSVTYLQDSAIELEGIRFWGSPWQPWFMDWAFNLPRRGERLKQVWNQIPPDTDVLITHTPPHGILDTVPSREHVGCEELKARLAVLRPRLHVFGHIHDSYGVARAGSTTYVNASTCDEAYRPVHRPVVVDLTAQGATILAPADLASLD